MLGPSGSTALAKEHSLFNLPFQFEILLMEFLVRGDHYTVMRTSSTRSCTLNVFQWSKSYIQQVDYQRYILIVQNLNQIKISAILSFKYIHIKWSNCLHWISQMQFKSSYIYKEGNQVADALAKFSSSLFDLIWWDLALLFVNSLCTETVYVFLILGFMLICVFIFLGGHVPSLFAFLYGKGLCHSYVLMYSYFSLF